MKDNICGLVKSKCIFFEGEQYHFHCNKINLFEEPIPNHKYCHIFKISFDNYNNHIKGKIHFDNTQKYSDVNNNINNVLKRVNNFWKIEKDGKDKGKKKNNSQRRKNNC